MQVEERELRVSAAGLATYVTTDAEVWMAFLSEQPGFIAKQEL